MTQSDEEETPDELINEEYLNDLHAKHLALEKEIARKKLSTPSFAADQIREVPKEATALFTDFANKPLEQKVNELKRLKVEQGAYLDELKRDRSKDLTKEAKGKPEPKPKPFPYHLTAEAIAARKQEGGSSGSGTRAPSAPPRPPKPDAAVSSGVHWTAQVHDGRTFWKHSQRGRGDPSDAAAPATKVKLEPNAEDTAEFNDKKSDHRWS